MLLGKSVPIFKKFKKIINFAQYLSIGQIVSKHITRKNVARSILKSARWFLIKYYACQMLFGKFVPIFKEFKKITNFAQYLSIWQIVSKYISREKTLLGVSLKVLVDF